MYTYKGCYKPVVSKELQPETVPLVVLTLEFCLPVAIVIDVIPAAMNAAMKLIPPQPMGVSLELELFYRLYLSIPQSSGVEWRREGICLVWVDRKSENE